MPGVSGPRMGRRFEIHRMPPMGERAYAYAKACGIIGKTFIGKRVRGLESTSRLSELDRMVFPASPRDLPEKELLVDLEDRIIERAVDSIISIVDCFTNPPDLLTLLVRGYEYEDLKNALAASLKGETSAPGHTDIGQFQTVRFDAWPDITSMISGTEYQFLLSDKSLLSRGQGSTTFQTALDRHYYSALWRSLSSLPKNDRFAVERILSDEISLRNSCWALRLRTYYQMNADEVKQHLIDLPAKADKSFRYKSKVRSLALEAIVSLDFPLDNLASWSSWRWKEFLNPEEMDGHWQADPRYFQNSASRYVNRLAAHYFHIHPFSMDSIFCFIKLKQFEEDILMSCTEGLGMGMPGRDIVSVLGVEP